MELTSGILSRADYLRAVEVVVGFLRSAGVSELLVANGFGCDSPDEQLYQDVPMPLNRLHSFMADWHLLTRLLSRGRTVAYFVRTLLQLRFPHGRFLPGSGAGGAIAVSVASFLHERTNCAIPSSTS